MSWLFGTVDLPLWLAVPTYLAGLAALGLWTTLLIALLVCPRNPRGALRHLDTVIRHKSYVLVAGRRLGVPLRRLLLHDWTKLTPTEVRGYVARYYTSDWRGRSPNPELHQRDTLWGRAWAHHLRWNDHHVEHWCSAGDGTDRPKWLHKNVDVMVCLPQRRELGEPILRGAMPEVCCREAVADWLAAGRAYEGSWPDPLEWKWFEAARPEMRLHPKSARRIDRIVAELRVAAQPLDAVEWHLLEQFCRAKEYRPPGLLGLWHSLQELSRSHLAQRVAGLREKGLIEDAPPVECGAPRGPADLLSDEEWFRWRGRASARGRRLQRARWAVETYSELEEQS